jgi:Na+-transporting methylmalonyl-CoA/oxaloacetate decarboxylase gamma subunit
MNKDHYPMYGIALVAGAAVAVWAGMPFVFLLFLACPLMMFFMMRGMGGMGSSTPAPPPANTVTPPVTPPVEEVEHR